MKSIAKLLIFLVLLPNVARSEQIIQYEPNVVEVSGHLMKGKFQHPNGTEVKFWALRLDTPTTINADAKNPFNVSENGIKEIQLFSNNLEIRKRLDKSSEEEVSVKGTLFHSHTAWHVRPLVMDVVEVKQK